jgi:hypothetical protein
MILKYTIAWLPMVCIAIMNGAIRELSYGKFLSELRAHQVSSVSVILLLGLYVWFLTRRWRLQSQTQAIAIGLIWLCLTIAFEFLFGHYVVNHSWERLTLDYNVFEGRLWMFVLVWIATAPYIMYKRSLV